MDQNKDKILEEENIAVDNLEQDNVDEVDLKEQENENVQVEEETKEEVVEAPVKAKKNRSKTVNKLLAGLIDQLVVASLSLIFILLFDFFIRFIGYKVVDGVGMYLIFYIIVNIIYPALCALIKVEGTYGTKIMSVK